MRSGRVPFWKTGAAIFAAHPLAGVGPGRVPAVFSSFRPPDLPVESENVHSWPLQCLAENGLAGGLLLLLPFAALVPLLVRGARVLRGPESGLVPGLAAAAAAGFVSHPFLLAQVQVVFWGTAALLERVVDEADPVEKRVSRAVRLVPLFLLVAWGLPRLVLAPGREAGRWGYGAWGFAEGEGRNEWVAPEAALYTALPPAGKPLRVQVRRPEPVLATEGMEVAARAGFGPWARVRLTDTGWNSLTLRPGVAGPEGVLVELRSSRAICPAFSGSGDRRILAVQLAKP